MAIVQKRYYLRNVDFNSATRIAKIDILEVQIHQTVERYVTRNYEKTPIYSEPREKEKHIYKTIKLTNDELENLYLNKDELICRFAQEIVYNLGNEDLEPSWYKIGCLKDEMKDEIKKIRDRVNIDKLRINNRIETVLKTIESERISLGKEQKTQDKLSKKYDRNKYALNKIENDRYRRLKVILTIGIYYLFVSPNRQQRIASKIVELKESIDKSSEKIARLVASISGYENTIENDKKKIKIIELKARGSIEQATHFYEQRMNEVQSLPCDIDITEESDFVPLKDIIGFNYEKIIGVYIIRNNQNGKYYVGQSKDVLKRLKQHFKGTVPTNPALAEDYYSPLVDNKEDLFGVKIIRCETKDELDRMESSLIEEYDSRNNGYNKTKGNT